VYKYMHSLCSIGYYVNKLRQNVGLEIRIRRRIVTLQTAHKYNDHPMSLNEKKNTKIVCVLHWVLLISQSNSISHS